MPTPPRHALPSRVGRALPQATLPRPRGLGLEDPRRAACRACTQTRPAGPFGDRPVARQAPGASRTTARGLIEDLPLALDVQRVGSATVAHDGDGLADDRSRRSIPSLVGGDLPCLPPSRHDGLVVVLEGGQLTRLSLVRRRLVQQLLNRRRYARRVEELIAASGCLAELGCVVVTPRRVPERLVRAALVEAQQLGSQHRPVALYLLGESARLAARQRVDGEGDTHAKTSAPRSLALRTAWE